MSQALRDVIPVMNLLQEMRERNFKVICIGPYVYCKVFEDNTGALELVRLQKLCPRTKHINVCYHPICKHLQKALIKIFPINTKDQIAKYLSDPRQSHGEAILHLVRYLKKMKDLGLKFKPDPKKGFECYCDAYFSGNWNREFAPVDPSTAKSQSGWIIFYAGCPSHVPPNFNLKLHCLLPRLSKSPCHKHYVMSFPS